MQYFLLKTEPETFSFDDLVSKGKEHWDGVRNYQARNFIQSMQPGDLCLIYHSGKEKAVVGIAAVDSLPYPDPTSPDDPRWLCVDVIPVKPIAVFSLEQIKNHIDLQDIMLLKQSRLSVMPLSKKAFEILSGGV